MNRLQRAGYLGLALLALVSLLIAFVPSVSATAPYTCVAGPATAQSWTPLSSRQAGPVQFLDMLAVTVGDDDCTVGTFAGEWREIHVPGGGFQAHGRGTFVGAFADGTGKLREGTIEWIGTLHGGGAQIDYEVRFLSGTGTNELANLHGVGIASIDFSTTPPTNPMVWQVHWDP